MKEPHKIAAPWIELTQVPTSLAPKIGRIFVQHSHLEIELSRAIWGMLHLDMGDGNLLTRTIRNFSDKATLFHDLTKLRQLDPIQRAQFLLFKTHVEIANADRNHLIHGEYIFGSAEPDEPKFYIQKADPLSPTGGNIYLFTKEALDDLEYRLRDLRVKLSMALRSDDDWPTGPFHRLIDRHRGF